MTGPTAILRLCSSSHWYVELCVNLIAPLLTSLYSVQKDTLHPLHVILQSFPSLPPKAAHFLFNSFIGIITRHTDQPCTLSSEIIQSVLLLVTMVSVCIMYIYTFTCIF